MLPEVAVSELDPFPTEQGRSVTLGPDAPDGGSPQSYLNPDQRAGVADNGKVSFTIDEAANRLVGGQPGWSPALRVGATVTYGFRADAPGVYYGQCSELCGTKHAFMPIVIEVLPPAQFRAWATAKLADGKIDRTPAIEAALTDATNGSAPAPKLAAAVPAAAPVPANDNNAAPDAAAIPAAGAVASQNSTSTAPTATK